MNIFYNVIADMNLMRVNARIIFWADRKILVHQTAGRHPPFLLYRDISRLKAKMRSYIGENGKIAVPEMTEDQKAEREAKIKAFQESIVYYEESPFTINITREEGNIMRSFEPEEYTSIIERMKKDDPGTYAKHKAALDEAKANGDTSTVFREYAGAYKWAYGDIFDKIHEKEPDVDIYV